MTETTAAPPSVTIESLKQSMLRYARFSLGKEWPTLTDRERFIAVSLAVRDGIMEAMLRSDRKATQSGKKRIYYLSMEFLAGRALTNNLLNLGIHEQCATALHELGANLEELLEMEPDPALGNGGLGRLAACFAESMATLGLPGYGYGINYEFGLFRQVFREGKQVELPDVWRSQGTPWLICRPDSSQTVPVYGRTVDRRAKNGDKHRVWVDTREIVGVPSDLPIVGFGGRTVNYLRLYAARASNEFDMEIFNAGDYVKALEQKISSERISKVLYPSANIPAGRELRLLQEYFFVACALRDIIARHGTSREALLQLHRTVAIQLNDTHPALAVAELIRILVDEHDIPFPAAMKVTRKTIAYTNHTLLPEAQERWSVELLARVLPRHLEVIYAVNDAFLEEVSRVWPSNDRRRRSLSIIDEADGRSVRMMHLCIVGSHAVNGVSRLHSELLKHHLVPDFYALWPDKFQNKTNGVTQRRWLLNANPELAQLLSKVVGERWIVDLSALHELEEHLSDAPFRDAFRAAKRARKRVLAKVILRTTGVKVDPASLFDVQVKRMHEYKRQLLNVLRIIHEYLRLVEDGVAPCVPRTYVFGGKAAPGYAAAKKIIHLINAVARVINQDARVQGCIKVTLIPDYKVTLAEKIIPAADVSEQISTAGMEASGTGNMKFMMNGALTVGTLDGANIEMIEEAGEQNFFTFGLTADQAGALRSNGSYDPGRLVAGDPTIERVIEQLRGNRFCTGKSHTFRNLADALLRQDPYLVLADLRDFLDVQERVSATFLDQEVWTTRCILNVARSGKFSSDRTIREYLRDIWGTA